MAFIRKKCISGKFYAYLVENTWTKGASKQKVSKYLGRIHEIQTSKKAAFSNIPAEELLLHAIGYELSSSKDDVRIDFEKKIIEVQNKNVVFALNQGFLCSYTLKELLKALHVRNEETPGMALAEALTRGGIRIPPADFIRLYLHYQGGT